MKAILLLLALLVTGFLPSLEAQEKKPSPGDHFMKGPHPVISDIIAGISKDSLTAYMESLVNLGTRFEYSDNRREVSEFIAAKFSSFGYTDVALDSFKIVGETIPADSIWQYNVIATALGSSAPEEIYLITAHHDDYMNPDPHLFAPGADDNASGVAAALEIARVFKVKGFQPAATIRFITWAAEELTYYVNTSGSIDYAERMAAGKEDLRLVVCNDMVANTSDTAYLVDGSYKPGPDVWTGELMLSSAALYTILQVIITDYPVADNIRFHELGFPNTGFMDYILTPYYHTINDSVSNCNMDFCHEVVKANCAILLNEQLTPVPQDPFTTSGKDFVTLSWKKTLNQNAKGFRIYRSSTLDTTFSAIAQITAPADSYKDTNVADGVLYTYYVTSVDALSFESLPSMQVNGAVSAKNKELLVVKDSRGGFNNPPDSLVDAFYQNIFSDLDHDFSDASVSDSLNIATLGRYQRIFWLSNTYSDQPNSSFRRNYNDITTYLKDGGQLFIAGFTPTFMISGNRMNKKTYAPEDTLYRFYRIQSVDRKPNAALNGAVPAGPDYDTLRIDPAKCMSQLAGHVINVECITPSPEATLIYRFNSAFDTNTSQGMMKGKPVGTEYLGSNFKVIVLSVPLYYIDFSDAKKLVETVAKDKFKSPTGFDNMVLPSKAMAFIKSYPNPSSGEVTVEYYLPERSDARIELISMTGDKVYSRAEAMKGKGLHSFTLPAGTLAPGLYLLALRTGSEVCSAKMIVL